jgi:hypothetical protein
MVLARGAKRWAIVPPSQRARLRERLAQHTFDGTVLDSGYASDSEECRNQGHGILDNQTSVCKVGQDEKQEEEYTYYEDVQLPGDLIFIPAASPHQVQNMPGNLTLAIAGNFVDSVNVDKFAAQLLELAMTTASQTGREYYMRLGVAMANSTTFARAGSAGTHEPLFAGPGYVGYHEWKRTFMFSSFE